MAKEKKSTVIAVVAGVVVLALLYFVFVRPMMMSGSGSGRVLLVASDVLAQAGGAEKFASYLSDKSVSVVAYNYDRVATYGELGDLVRSHMESKGASRARSVGIMYHTPNRYNLQCFASDPAKSTVDGSVESFESFRRFVVALRAAYGVEDVDLVSCDVVSAGTSVLSALDFNGARVNASTNTTGQVKQGPIGDWVLESGNVNLIGRYFNAEITKIDVALTTQAQYTVGQFVMYNGQQYRVSNRGYDNATSTWWYNIPAGNNRSSIQVHQVGASLVLYKPQAYNTPPARFAVGEVVSYNRATHKVSFRGFDTSIKKWYYIVAPTAGGRGQQRWEHELTK